MECDALQVKKVGATGKWLKKPSECHVAKHAALDVKIKSIGMILQDFNSKKMDLLILFCFNQHDFIGD